MDETIIWLMTERGKPKKDPDPYWVGYVILMLMLFLLFIKEVSKWMNAE